MNTATINPPTTTDETTTDETTTNETTTGERRRDPVWRVVGGSLAIGFVGALILTLVVFGGATEPIISGAALLGFAGGWALLARLSARYTSQPQTWARVPAIAMAIVGAVLLITQPADRALTAAGWVWPPAVVALVVWMAIQARRDLRSRARVVVLYPVFVALALSAVGGSYQTYRESGEPSAGPMPGQLFDVGGHKLHINCTGSGSPTVVLEPGLGEPSPMVSAWIAPNVATATRVCVYDRAGRGWSESAEHPQDGVEVATDLHTLLVRAGEPGPYVLAGHSAGGIYVLNFANLFPDDVAGVVLLDSMHPQQYTRMASWPSFYEMFRRGSALMPSLARLGIGQVAYGSQFNDMPATQRDQERAFLATARHARSVRDEFSMIRKAMDQAATLKSLGNTPLIVVTAERQAADDGDWMPMQDDLASLSTNSEHRTLANATHEMVVEDENTAKLASQAIVDMVTAIRTDSTAVDTPTPTQTLLPTPSGQDAIGVRELASLSPDSTARLWYPAEVGTGNGEPTYASVEVTASLGLPAGIFDDLHVGATLNASPAATGTPRPAVVLMPGLRAPMAVYTSLTTELVSNGYVVLSIEPNVGTENESGMPGDPTQPSPRLEQLTSALSFLTSPDVAALAGPIDATRLAVGGHSLAGAIAVQASLIDNRITAVFDLDGWLHGAALDTAVNVPALFVEASGFDEATKNAIGLSTTAVTIRLAGATHFDVTDVPCLAPALGAAATRIDLGPIGCTGAITTNALVERFLDVVLRDLAPTPTAAYLTAGLAGVQ